jgi:hypothetical protein
MGSMVGDMPMPRKIRVNVFTHADEVTNPAVLEKMKNLRDTARIAATARLRSAVVQSRAAGDRIPGWCALSRVRITHESLFLGGLHG